SKCTGAPPRTSPTAAARMRLCARSTTGYPDQLSPEAGPVDPRHARRPRDRYRSDCGGQWLARADRAGFRPAGNGAALSGGPRLLGRPSASQFGDVGPPRRSRPLPLHFPFTRGYVCVYVRGVLQIKCDQLVNQSQGQRGKRLLERLRRKAFVVVEHNVLQADSVTRDVDETVGVLGEKVRQCHGGCPPKAFGGIIAGVSTA